MRRTYKILIKTADIFNFTTSVMIKQYDAKPEILSFYDSGEGQITELRITCTPNERLIINVALKDYILRIVPCDKNGRELSLWERMVQGWL